MEKLVIINYGTSEVHFYEVDTDLNIDEEYIKNLGHDPDECSWMFGETIGVMVHKETLR